MSQEPTFNQQGKCLQRSITLPNNIETIPQLGIIPTAQENAARVLVPLIAQMGYEEKDIIIQFRKEYGLNDIQSLINMNIENAKRK